jgi:hypothetical protein
VPARSFIQTRLLIIYTGEVCISTGWTNLAFEKGGRVKSRRRESWRRKLQEAEQFRTAEKIRWWAGGESAEAAIV